MLNINNNIIIKNQYTIKAEKAKSISKFIQNRQNLFYELLDNTEGDYCLRIRQSIQTNQELMDVLKLQGIYLSCIVPNDSFDWKHFLDNWKEDERGLLASGQAAFVCNVIDMERALDLIFNTEKYSLQEIECVLNKWKEAMRRLAGNLPVRKTVGQMRDRYGKKQVVWICFG